ncbi:MAG: NUDIX hydrolase [Caldilineaceae bacterium]|nr:NUDIX hydrolase [Caldilineaceae bacterium]
MDESIHFCVKCGKDVVWQPLGDNGKSHPKCQSCGFILWQHPYPSVDALIVRQTSQSMDVLLGRRSRDPKAGMWDVPGGFIGIDDDPIQVIKRECLAEFDADVIVVKPVGAFLEVFDGQQLVSIFHVCELMDDRFSTTDRVDQIRWYSVDRLPPLAFQSVAKAVKELR